MKCLGIERVTWSGKVTSMLHLSKDEPFPKYKKKMHILPKKGVQTQQQDWKNYSPHIFNVSKVQTIEEMENGQMLLINVASLE